jgi:hypothetical protein
MARGELVIIVCREILLGHILTWADPRIYKTISSCDPADIGIVGAADLSLLNWKGDRKVYIQLA